MTDESMIITHRELDYYKDRLVNEQRLRTEAEVRIMREVGLRESREIWLREIANFVRGGANMLLSEIPRAIGLVIHEFKDLIGELKDSRDKAMADCDTYKKAENEVSDAYVRVRGILDALTTPPDMTSFQHTEKRAHAAMMAEQRQLWQPIATAPQSSKHILVWTPNNQCSAIVTWHDGEDGAYWHHAYSSRRLVEIPSHWMPAPIGPKHA